MEQTRNAMISETSATAITFSHGVMDTLDHKIHESMHSLEIIAIDPQVRQLVIESNHEFEKINDIQSHIAEKEAEWISYTGKENPIFNELVKNPLSQRIEEYSQIFHESNEVDIFPEIFVTNKHGATIAENNRLTDWDQSDELPFQNTRDYGWYISDLVFDSSADVWGLEIAIAVKDGDEYVGMIKTIYNIEDVIKAFIDSTEEFPYETSIFGFATGDNRAIYFTDASFSIGDDITPLIEYLEIRDIGEGIFFGTYPPTGEKNIVAFSTSDGYRDFEGLNWVSGVIINENEFLDTTNHLTNILIITMIISGIVAIIVGISMVRGTIPPLEKIEKLAQKISMGKFDVNVDITTNDEFGSLAKSMNEMVSQLKQTTKEKGEFSAMITHELKTPLSTIIGYGEMLKDPKMGELNKDQKKAIDEIAVSATALEHIIENILTAQKIDQLKLTYKIEKISARRLLKESHDRLLPLMLEKQISFWSYTENETIISIDKERIIQVFENLVQNSIDFVPVSEGRIEITCNNKDSDILFSVKDNGTGMPKNKLKNLFQKYYQIDTSMTRKHGGSGLGLAICKGIVESFGGKIWVESEEGKGTIIYFTIPKESRV